MSDQTGPTFVCVGGIFIDDIVYPNGKTSMEILGGGGTHAAAGMLVWGERAGLVSVQGVGIPESALTRLEQDFDLQGMYPIEAKQARAWQLFEWDGRRIEVHRVSEEDIAQFLLRPQPDELPEPYRHAKGAAILRSGKEFLRWREVFPEAFKFWEPDQAYMIPENSAEFRAVLPMADAVSPNLLEASLVYGLTDAHALIDAMLADGAKMIALRMGEAGSLVATPQQRFTIPAVPVPQVIDQTGAGNSYCGGFIVGWCRTHDLRLAGYYGAVAASFSLEEVGVLHAPDPALRDERYRQLVAKTTP